MTVILVLSTISAFLVIDHFQIRTSQSLNLDRLVRLLASAILLSVIHRWSSEKAHPSAEQQQT